VAREDELDELYALPPAEFVAARDALAKRLKAEGDAEGAKEIKALRRPTAAAWAVNQLARNHAGALGELLELGERLRRAQAKALSGRGAGMLKELLAERRASVERVARLAVRELGSGTAGAAQRDAIVATLEAALADPDAAAAVEAGRLSRELPAPAGFGLGEWSPSPVDDDGDEDEDDNEDTPRTDGDRERRRAQHAVDEKRGALRQAVDSADAAAREHETALREVERLSEQLDAARQRAERAAERRRLADRRAGVALDELDAAERTLRDLNVEERRSDAQR
jgi:hypothetical protein